MKNKNKKNDFKLNLKVGVESSELIKKLEKIIKDDLTSQKLPKDLKKS